MHKSISNEEERIQFYIKQIERYVTIKYSWLDIKSPKLKKQINNLALRIFTDEQLKKEEKDV